MADLRRDVFRHYKVFRTTSMVDEDMKSMRKINNLIKKFTNTGKDKYQYEAINILKMISNLVNFGDDFILLMKTKMIDEDNHPIFEAFAERV